jgi:hypothetical protein
MEISVLWQRQIRPAKLAKSKRAWRRTPEETNEEAATQLAQSDLQCGAEWDQGQQEQRPNKRLGGGRKENQGRNTCA